MICSKLIFANPLFYSKSRLHKKHRPERLSLYYSDSRKVESDRWKEIEKDGIKLVCHTCIKRHFANFDQPISKRYRFPITDEGRKVSIIR